MVYVDIVMALAAIQFLAFGMQVGAARGRYGVKAPAVTGHEMFDRYFRVQQNSLETLIVFLPGLLLFSRYVDAAWGAGLGAVYLIGRQIYAYSYVKNPPSRGPGFGLSLLPTVILLVGGLGAAIWRALHPVAAG